MGLVGTQAAHLSVLYAVLESACNTLEISREDIGGTLIPHSAGSWSFVFYDAVPGGAGHVLMVEGELTRILHAALERVSSCDCGEETSCYGCLRSYSNQRDHEVLSRGLARSVLGRLLGDDHASIDTATLSSTEGIEDRLLRELSVAGAPAPAIGHESGQGIPIGISWPPLAIAVDLDIDESDREELIREGWVLLEADPLVILSELAHRTPSTPMDGP